MELHKMQHTNLIHLASTKEMNLNKPFKHKKGLPCQFSQHLSMNHWCKLVDQANMTLNMIGPCCKHPALLAQEALNRSFFFRVISFVPPGTKTLVYEKPIMQEHNIAKN